MEMEKEQSLWRVLMIRANGRIDLVRKAGVFDFFLFDCGAFEFGEGVGRETGCVKPVFVVVLTLVLRYLRERYGVPLDLTRYFPSLPAFFGAECIRCGGGV